MEIVREVEDTKIFGIAVPSSEHIGFIYEQCIFPNVVQMFGKGIWMLIGTFGFNYLSRLATHHVVFHMLSYFFGLFMLRYSVFDLYLTICFAGIVIYSFIIIYSIFLIKKHILPEFQYFGYVIMAALTISMILGEITFPDNEAWFRLRGTAMLICMKGVTFGFSCDEKNCLKNIFPYVGYVFFPGNILFGPWIPFNDYMKMYTTRQKFTPKTVIKVIQLFIYSITMLWLSNCILPLIELDSYYHAWIQAFFEALTFRMSHYFIIGLSELTLISSGYIDSSEKNTHYISSRFTNPLEIEFPRSMLSVVVNWNIPIHRFLKQYVFQESVKIFGKFGSIFVTYFYSSILHGINVEVAVILLSLGLFSYVEMQMRELLSQKLDACVRSRPCPADCNHKHRNNSFRTAIINDAFILLTIVQLIYTGCLMYSRDEKTRFFDTLRNIHQKWSNLGYFCHYLALIMFAVTVNF